ncbi:hypothetical protein [Streptomyces sp. 2A115]|uniref:hypothetical protein n=1 Tax=Streptomyces sp. 2A115 TaxID=3457439 RepID=UPI003FD1E67B
MVRAAWRLWSKQRDLAAEVGAHLDAVARWQALKAEGAARGGRGLREVELLTEQLMLDFKDVVTGLAQGELRQPLLAIRL